MVLPAGLGTLRPIQIGRQHDVKACAIGFHDGFLGRAEAAIGKTGPHQIRDVGRDNGSAGGDRRAVEGPVEDVVILVAAAG